MEQQTKNDLHNEVWKHIQNECHDLYTTMNNDIPKIDSDIVFRIFVYKKLAEMFIRIKNIENKISNE